MGKLDAAPSLASTSDPDDFWSEVQKLAKHFYGQLDVNNVAASMSAGEKLSETQIRFDTRIQGWGHNHYFGKTYDSATEIGIRPLRRHIDATSSLVVWNDLFGQMGGVWVVRGRSTSVATGTGTWSSTLSTLVSANPYPEPRPFTSTGQFYTAALANWIPRGAYTQTGQECMLIRVTTANAKTSSPASFTAHGYGFTGGQTVDVFATLFITKQITGD